MKRNQIVGLILVRTVVAARAVVSRPLASFQTTTVDEAFPFEGMTEAQQETYRAMPDDMKTALTAMAADEAVAPEMVKETTLAVMQPDSQVMEEPMTGMDPETTALRSGEFGQIDAIHKASGTATLYRLPDGQHVVRLEDFSSTNGPELHVILTTGTARETFADVGEYIDLGLLKGNVGNQNYEVPADVDLAPIQSVVIYCRPFRVVFSVADLE